MQAFHLHASVGDLYTADSSYRMVEVVKKGLNPKLGKLPHNFYQGIADSLEQLN